MPDNLFEHYQDLAAEMGWSACADCGTWMHGSQLLPLENGPVALCLPCLLARRLAAFIAQEEKALEDDGPSGACAARHRGEITAYRNALEWVREYRLAPTLFDARAARRAGGDE